MDLNRIFDTGIYVENVFFFSVLHVIKITPCTKAVKRVYSRISNRPRLFRLVYRSSVI